MRASVGRAKLTDRIGLAFLLLLPPMLLHGRGIADILICALDLLFLARCLRNRDWGWLRQNWVAVAAAFWVWMVVCTALVGEARPLGKAVVTIRLLLLVAACQIWLLRLPQAGTYLAVVFAACAGWVALEVWQQYLFGADLFGYRRAGDGILTGPFQKERAGPAYLDLFFPAVLPLVMPLLASRPLRDKLLGLLLLLLAAASMLLIGQRMPALLMFLGLATTALLVRGLRLPVCVALAACAAFAAALPVLSPPTFQRLVLHFLEQMRHFWVSDYGHLFVRAVAMVRAHPWLGLGYDGFRNNCYDPALLGGDPWLGIAQSRIDAVVDGCNLHPHNYWLEVATSFGLPGMVLFTALVLLWLAAMAGVVRRRPGAVQTGVLVGAVVLLWPIASRSSLFVVDAGGWAFLVVGWGLAAARARDDG